MSHKYFLAPLNRLHPEAGTGIYETATGACRAYTDGDAWFFEMGTGRPSFYASEGALYLPDGSVANLDADLSPLKDMAKAREAKLAKDRITLEKSRIMMRAREPGGLADAD